MCSGKVAERFTGVRYICVYLAHEPVRPILGNERCQPLNDCLHYLHSQLRYMYICLEDIVVTFLFIF